MPVAWVAPLVLTVGALRYRPVIQVWMTLLLVGGFVAVALALVVLAHPAAAQSAAAPITMLLPATLLL